MEARRYVCRRLRSSRASSAPADLNGLNARIIKLYHSPDVSRVRVRLESVYVPANTAVFERAIIVFCIDRRRDASNPARVTHEWIADNECIRLVFHFLKTEKPVKSY